MSVPKKNLAEWAVFAVSLALVLGAVGFLVAQIAEAGDEPARIVVAVGAPDPRDGQLVVPLSVSNEGDGMAEDVRVEVTLERPDAGPETVEIGFARLARRELAEGEAVFADDGGEPGTVTARVLSYTLP